MPDAPTPVLAIDIGGTKIAGGVVHGPTVAHPAQAPTPSRQGARAVVDAAGRVARSALDAHVAAGGGQPSALAVASAGVVDPAGGTILAATDAIRDWTGTALRDELAQRAGLPVHVLNDVQAHALGEYRHGRGTGHPSMLLVAAGTGIGGGLVVDGRLVLGSGNLAGHVGHVDVTAAHDVPCSCGRRGHVEAIASGTGIEQHFRRRTGEHRTGAEIAALAGTDDPHATTARLVIETAGHALGRAVGGLLNALDPGLVVLAGSVPRAGERWWDALRAGVQESAMPVVADTPVVPAALDNAALVGAACWAAPAHREEPR